MRGRISVLICVSLMVAVLCGIADAGTKVLRFAEFGPNAGVRAKGLQWFADELQKRSKGSLSLQIHWGGALLKGQNILKGVKDGVADMGSIAAAYAPKPLRLYAVGDLPLGNTDPWVGMRAMYKLVTTDPAFKKFFSALGVTYVTNYTTGAVQLICRKPLTKVDQLKKLKLRGTGPYAKCFSALGASVHRMPQPDVYQALDSGLLDCNQNYYYSMRAYRQYEVAPYVIELEWGQNLGFGIIINTRVFKSLTPEQQKAVRETGEAFIDYFAQVMAKAENQDLAIMQKKNKNVKLLKLPADQRALLIEAGRKQVDVWLKQVTGSGLPGKEVLGSYERLTAEYKQVLKKEGYPWTR